MLKNDRLKDKDKKHETENLLGPLPDDMFSKLVNLGKKITDFQVTKPLTGGTGGGDEALDDGINVQFEESEEEDDEDVYGEVKDDDDEEDLEGEEAKDSSAIQAQNVSSSVLFLIYFLDLDLSIVLFKVCVFSWSLTVLRRKRKPSIPLRLMLIGFSETCLNITRIPLHLKRGRRRF